MSTKREQEERPDERTFGEVIGELEAILARIEGEATDIDHLARELERAGALLEVARAKIRRAEVEVSEIVQKFGGDGSDESA